MILSKGHPGKPNLAGWRTPELPTPDQQRFVPQAGPLEIGHQGGNRLVGFASVELVVLPILPIKIF
jgi:hypothetical protein